MSRPRRFGKSLLLSTLEAIFRGRRELFAGLWIDGSDYAWEKHPVVRVDITDLAARERRSEGELRAQIRQWYDGFCFAAGEEPVYNPFSLLLLFKQCRFANHWFESGTPTFLIELLKKRRYDVRDLEDLQVDELAFSSYEVEDLRPVPLLVQTGYLTIKGYDPESRLYTLSYPNFEVENAFLRHLLSTFSGAENGVLGGTLWQLSTALREREWERFFEFLQGFFAAIPYDIQRPQERYYQTVFYLIFKLLGLQVGVEIGRNRGECGMRERRAMGDNELPVSYNQFLQQLKDQIRQARLHTMLAANRELVMLYWRIGSEILTRQQQAGWGAKVIDRLAADLRREFPDMKGFSARNLKYMRAFAEIYIEASFVQQLAAQIPWYHNCLLMDKVKDPTEREWYIRKTVEHGWSRHVLAVHIESGLYQRAGRAISNFTLTLPAPQSDLAQQITKDPYLFDFLTLAEDAGERALEHGLLAHIRDFLLELGVGFGFLGSQYHLEVGDQDYYLDLLFYHVRLRCYVVIDLKIADFKPEYAGKMNFYLSAVDDLLRHDDDQPSIGLILCKTRNRIIAEYALRDMTKPIGVAEWTTRLVESLPENLEGSLPTVEELEAALAGVRE